MCSICLGRLTGLIALSCGHRVHVSCYCRWWLNNPYKSVTCPECRHTGQIKMLFIGENVFCIAMQIQNGFAVAGYLIPNNFKKYLSLFIPSIGYATFKITLNNKIYGLDHTIFVLNKPQVYKNITNLTKGILDILNEPIS